MTQHDSIPTAQPGDLVQIRYTLRTQGEVLLENSERGEPLEFRTGDPAVIAGVSQGVVGLRVGERRRLSIPPEQAFGDRDVRRQIGVPRDFLPAGIREGDQLCVSLAGQSLDVWVRAIRDDDVILDANHPLVGEPLVVDVQVVSVATGTNGKGV